MSTGQDFFVLSCPVLLLTFVLAGGRTGLKPKTHPVLQDRTPGPPVLCSALMSIFCPVLPCPVSYLRPGGRQDRTKTKNASCPTGQDTRTACLVLSSDEHFLSCPALSCFLSSSWRAAGQERTEQDRTKIKNASCPTGQDTRTACPVLSSDA